MQKTKIEWVKNPDGTQGYSWNPIKGDCPQKCKLPDGRIYCYGRSGNIRFKRERKPCFDLFECSRVYRSSEKSIGIFICSTFDLFHPITLTEFKYPIDVRMRQKLIRSGSKITWKDIILSLIEDNPQHRFYILTKFPQNIDRPMPDNVWLGVTVTMNKELSRITQLCSVEAKKRFVSFEPLLGFIQWNGFRLEFSSLDWIIVGQLTRHGKKYEPMKYWINQIKFYAGYYGIPLFMKDNLKEIWGEPLIQEMPSS